ncbi:MAG: hypothetical protein UZ21_OP11001000032 [Microgenomates bacterium OLB22]|nr:MAG: hypothetical protein UZ21_OP11001000032 [Microgenomates bacterium OLB22]
MFMVFFYKPARGDTPPHVSRTDPILELGDTFDAIASAPSGAQFTISDISDHDYIDLLSGYVV